MLETIIQFLFKQRLHQLQIADWVVHQVDLSFQDQEVIQRFRMLYHRRLIFYLYDGLFIIRLDLNVRFSAYRIPSQIKRFQCLPWYGNTLFSHMLVTEPISCVITLVLIASNEVKALLQWFATLKTHLFFFL